MKSTVAPYATAAWCVRIECASGLIVRLTPYLLDLKMSNGNVYLTDAGYEATAYQATATMAPSAIDVEGIAGIVGISRDEIASGIFDSARVKIFKCDFLDPVEDHEPITTGFFGKVTLKDDRYRVEGMSLIDALGQSVGRTYSAPCQRTFGDAGCTIDLTTLDVTGTLTHVTSASVFRDSSRAEALDYFAGGTVAFTSGPNAGLKPLNIKAYAADGTITTYEPAYFNLSVGETCVLIPGCRKRLEDCRDKWDNVINFFGFPHIPTTTTYSKVGNQ